MVAVDLDDLGVLGPVVEAVLRQRAERPEARAERQHHVGLGDELHRRLRALIAERAAPQRMVGRERVVVQIAVDHRRLQVFGQRLGLFRPAREDHAAAGNDHGELGLAQQLGRLVQALLGAGAARHVLRPRDLAVDLAVEIVARNVELGRPALRQRHVEAAPGVLGDAGGVVDVALVLGDLGEDRQLLGLLEAAEPHRHRSRLRRDHDDRRMRPVGRRRRGDEVGDARAVLGDAHAVAARHARIAVRHVAGALLMHGWDEADAGRREEVEGIHVGRADDAEDVLDAMGDERLNECLAGRHFRHAATPYNGACVDKKQVVPSRFSHTR